MLATLIRTLAPGSGEGATLVLGDVPLSIIGEASLREQTDVVEPDPTRARGIQRAAPQARILRATLPAALPRLRDYDRVVAGPLHRVTGAWNWTEAFDTTLRLIDLAERGVVCVKFEETPEPFDATAPLNVWQLSDHVNGRGCVLAAEPLEPSGDHLLAYTPGASDHLAANVLSRPGTEVSGEPMLEPCFRVAARLRLGALSTGAPWGAVTSSRDVQPAASITRLSSTRPQQLTAPPMGAALTPLAHALAVAVMQARWADARQMVERYRQVDSTSDGHPSVWSCSLDEQTGDVMALDPPDLVDTADNALHDIARALATEVRLPGLMDESAVLRLFHEGQVMP